MAPMTERATTVDPDEIAHFTALAEEWWDHKGKFAQLHRMNPVRLSFVKEIVTRHFRKPATADRPIAGLRLLDIGCGGGILTEPLARLGGEIVGADAGAEAIAVARHHAAEAGLAIDYRPTTAEELAAEGERFDAVLAMEIVEHVADRAFFLKACAELTKPGGLLVVATINRTMRSFALAIVAAEYILGWLPRGSHDWNRLVRPDELEIEFTRNRLRKVAETGVVYDPVAGTWRRAGDMAVNYILAAAKPA
jgi:2-polyprenyl-6-hydroxyphenyl methylase/3-demethylubiquinone-9 3-methyltransferase